MLGVYGPEREAERAEKRLLGLVRLIVEAGDDADADGLPIPPPAFAEDPWGRFDVFNDSVGHSPSSLPSREGVTSLLALADASPRPRSIDDRTPLRSRPVFGRAFSERFKPERPKVEVEEKLAAAASELSRLGGMPSLLAVSEGPFEPLLT